MSFWHYVYRVAYGLLILLVTIGLISLFYPQYRQYRGYKEREDELREQIRMEQELIQALKRKQEKFDHDPRFVEQIAHEVGLARPDETIYKFVDDPPTSSLTSAKE